MKPAPFNYYDPATVEEAVELCADKEDCRLLAGGQSLMPMMNFRFVQPTNIIDLNCVVALDFIRLEPDCLAFGAMARQRTIKESAEVRAAAPIVQSALSHVGHRQTRARGTIGGSISHFDPSAELCNMAALHDAEIVLARKGRARTLSFDHFGLGYMTTAIEPDELLQEVRFRPWKRPHGFAFQEFAMRHGDFAICAVSCLVTLTGQGLVDDLAIAVSGVMPTPQRLRSMEVASRGRRPDHEFYREAGVQAAALDAMNDAYTSADYRRHLARILTYRAVESACAHAAQEAA